jgi:hypothetical protein
MNFVYTIRVTNRSDFQTIYETPIVIGIEEAEKIKRKLEEVHNILPIEEVEEALTRLKEQDPSLSDAQLAELRMTLGGPVAVQIVNKVAVDTCEEWLRDHYKVNIVKRRR